VSQTVWPYLFYADVDAASDFLQRAFGFREIDRSTGAAGGTHLELETESGGRIYAGETSGYEGRSGMVFVLVPDVHAHYERAEAEGAEIFEELWAGRSPPLQLRRPAGTVVGVRHRDDDVRRLRP
jgi:uncharacterized glyoxalase superfamily protein PhnB